MSFGKNLQKLRKKNGYSQEEMAEKLFVTRQAVSKWESDTALPDLEKLKSIASLFNVSLDELVNGEEVDKEKNQEGVNNTSKSKVDEIVEAIAASVQKIAKMLSVKDTNEIVKFIFEIFVILLVIMIFKIPFIWLEDLGRNLFLEFDSVGRVFYQFWEFLFELAYLILAVTAFAYIFKIRYLDNFDESEYERKSNLKRNEKVKGEEVEKSKNTQENSDEKNTDVNSMKIKAKTNSVLDSLFQVCLIFIKLIAGCFVVAFSISLLCLLVMFAYSIYILTLGVNFVGVMLGLLGICVFLIMIISLLINFISNNAVKVGGVVFSLIFSFALISSGVVIGTIEFSSYTFINSAPDDFVTTTEFVYPYNERLYIEDYFIDKYEVDNTLNDNIKIVLAHPKVLEGFSLDSDGYELSIDYESEINVNLKDIFDMVIRDLKNKTVYSYNDAIKVTIYGNSEMIEAIKRNSYNNRIYYE